MNKWLIFIIIVVGVSGASLVSKYVGNSSDSVGVDYSRVRLVNVSEYTVSPGVFVVHDSRVVRDDQFPMNFLGVQAPEAYESLAEVGDPSAVIALLNDMSGVVAVRQVAGLDSGADYIVHDVPSGDGMLFSYMAMVVETNDGVVWFNRIPVDAMKVADLAQLRDGNLFAEVLDMGTEENSPIGSGFSGGQFDPLRGSENVENGVSTDAVVRHHPQFYEGSLVSFDIVRAELMP